jgi:hypothetical protein
MSRGVAHHHPSRRDSASARRDREKFQILKNIKGAGLAVAHEVGKTTRAVAHEAEKTVTKSVTAVSNSVANVAEGMTVPLIAGGVLVAIYLLKK